MRRACPLDTHTAMDRPDPIKWPGTTPHRANVPADPPVSADPHLLLWLYLHSTLLLLRMALSPKIDEHPNATLALSTLLLLLLLLLMPPSTTYPGLSFLPGLDVRRLRVVSCEQ